MKNKNPQKSRINLVGFIIFFFTISAVIAGAVGTYILVSRLTSDNNTITLVMLVVIVVFALLGSVADLIRRKIMVDKPTEKILDATEKISYGDFTTRLIPEHSPDHFDQYDLIMENLNLMTEQLEKMQVINSDFVSAVSHEFKTPLSVIRGYATALNDEKLDEQTRQDYTSAIISASGKLSSLISSVLLLNKLENQKLKPDLARFNLSSALEEVALNFVSAIEEKNIDFSCELNDCFVYSNRDFLDIVWNNLLSNAIKFTDDGGKITLSCKRVGGKVEVCVADNGCGISESAGKRIFDKFYQADDSRAVNGNGLGLALVKKVIDLVGGEIYVVSNLNKGSTFTIKLDAVD